MKLLAVDSNSIMNRAFYGVRPLTTKDGIYTHAVYGFINIILKILEDVKPDCVVFCFDVKRETFRNEKYADYKGSRKPTPPELISQFPLIKEFISLWGYKCVSLEGYEADDIIGTFAKSAKGDDTVVIATGDRDSLQLVGSNVSVRLATTKMGKPEAVIYTSREIMEKYGTTPAGLIEIKALMGDTSDNIPGVPGIGEKGAVDLISKYETIDNIYQNIDTIDISPKLREKLINGKESAYLSHYLGTIFCEVPIDRDFSHYVKEETSGELGDFLGRLELFSIAKKIGTPQISDSDAPVLQSSADCKIITDEEKSIKALENETRLFCDLRDGELVFTADGCVYKITDENKIIGALTGKEIYCVNSKCIYKFLIERGITPPLCKFDLELASYLISANMTNYSAENLCKAFRVPYTEIPDLLGGEFISGVISLPPLYEITSKTLSDTGNDKLFYDIELPLAYVLADMEHTGVKVDKKGIEDFGVMLTEKAETLTKEIYGEAGKEFNINSPKQLGEVLFVDLALPGGKKTKSGYSTSADVLDSLKNDYKIVSDILEYRKITKLNSTYVSGLLKTVENGRIHTTFNQTETRTGRISSAEPNLQNIPVRTELGREMRRFFTADEGRVLVDADYSQIELRVLCHMSGDSALTEAFLSGEDVHKKAAMSVFGLPAEMITPELRRRAKAVNFGIVYGIGAFSLAGDIGVSVKEAREYIKNYLTVYGGVDEFMKKTVSDAKSCGFVSTLYGRRRYIPEFSSSNKMMIAFGERVAMNAPIQGTAADIIKIAMIKVHDRLAREIPDAHLILQIHDELMIDCKAEDAEKTMALLKEEMESAVKLSVPLTVDVNCGRTWYDTK